MINKDFHLIFYTILAAILFLLLGSWFDSSNAEDVAPAPQTDGTIVITKHDLILLQAYIQQLQLQAERAQKKADSWEKKYETAEDCVREALKAGKMVTPCFNDVES